MNFRLAMNKSFWRNPLDICASDLYHGGSDNEGCFSVNDTDSTLFHHIHPNNSSTSSNKFPIYKTHTVYLYVLRFIFPSRTC